MKTKSQLIDLLRNIWTDLDELATGLTPEQWRTPVLPGWDAQDTLAHIVGTEKMLAGGVGEMEARIADAVASASATDRPHVRNPIGMTNEEWVEHYRSFSPNDVLADFRATTVGRLAALEAMSDEEFAKESWTPAGQGSYASFMQIRVFDCWMHDQDIRHAVGLRGNDGGPAAEASLDEVVGALGFVVGKRGQAPKGTVIAISLTGPVTRTLYVDVNDRARVVTAISRDPDVTISLDSSLFFRLSGGRVSYDSVADQVAINGDIELGRRVAANLAFTV